MLAFTNHNEGPAIIPQTTFGSTDKHTNRTSTNFHSFEKVDSFSPKDESTTFSCIPAELYMVQHHTTTESQWLDAPGTMPPKRKKTSYKETWLHIVT